MKLKWDRYHGRHVDFPGIAAEQRNVIFRIPPVSDHLRDDYGSRDGGREG